MTGNMAISLRMASRSRRRSSSGPPKSQKVSARYGAYLADVARRIGLSMEEWARKAEVSYETVWRVTRGQGSVKSTRALREVLIAAGQKVPPISFGDEAKSRSKIDEWTELGMRLSELSPEGYDSALEKIREIVRAHMIVRGGLSLGTEVNGHRKRAESEPPPDDVNDDQ